MKKKIYVCAEDSSSAGYFGDTPKEAFETFREDTGSTRDPEDCYFIEGEVIQVESKIEKIVTTLESLQVKVSK